MSRHATVTMTESGTLKLPASIRSKFPAGAEFAVSMNNGDLVLRQLNHQAQSSDEDWTRFDAAMKDLRQWAKEENVTVAKLKRTLEKVRRDKANKASGRS